MPFVAPDLAPAAAEIAMLAMICIVLVVDVYSPPALARLSYFLAQGSLVVAAVICVAVYPGAERVVTFDGTYVSDSMGSLLKIFVMLVAYYAFFYMRVYLVERGRYRGEFFLLGLFAVLGMMILISAGSLLTVYLGLELLSLSLYALVALDRDSTTASEAAMKYFVLGALASGMLLYGMSLLYGVTGTLDLAVLAERVSGAGEQSLVQIVGLVFIVIGIAFKLGAVPFHMWVPDVYEGAPTPVTLFVGSVPKLAAFGMLVRLLGDGLPGLFETWRDMLMILAVLSIAIGNVVAIAQTNFKRMLAYSTISHVGFLLLGVIAGGSDGFAASMFYVIVYTMMSAGAFALVVLLGHAGFEADRLTDFRGLNARSPWFAFLTLILMLSMAGVPPFLGFWAKWSVLRELVASGMVWLAVVAVLLAVIGLFYYLRVIRMVYFEEPEVVEPVVASPEMRWMLSSNALAILALGVYPGALMALCVSAF